MHFATKLMNCQVNMTYFVENHEILNYFEEIEEQIPWKHNVYCPCDASILYFSEEYVLNHNLIMGLTFRDSSSIYKSTFEM